jgi:hypothetical protein
MNEPHPSKRESGCDPRRGDAARAAGHRVEALAKNGCGAALPEALIL